MNSADNLASKTVMDEENKTHNYIITESVYKSFLCAFGDESPIHVDENEARAAGFPTVVMHGNILNGFISHFVGMIYPGRQSLLMSVDIRYVNPSYMNDEIEIKAKVVHFLESKKVIELLLMLNNITQSYTAAKCKVIVKLREQ